MSISEDVMAKVQASDDLVHAAGHGRLEALKSAIAAGGNVNYLRSDQGALMMTVHGRHEACTLLLLENGADPNQKSRTWWTPLHEASANDFAEILTPLLAAGANIDGQDIDGSTPLMAAVRNRSKESARVLLEAGAQVDQLDYDHNTALSAAVANEDAEMVQMLIARGATVGRANQAGQTVVDAAREAGWTAGVALLQQGERFQSRAQEPAAQPSADNTPTGQGISRIGKRSGPR